MQHFWLIVLRQSSLPLLPSLLPSCCCPAAVTMQLPGVFGAAMQGSHQRELRWGGIADSIVHSAAGSESGFDDDDDGPGAALMGAEPRRKKAPKCKPRRKSCGSNFNSKASLFCQLTPWNKIELLNEVCGSHFGYLYMSSATTDELDAAIWVGCNKSPNDKILFREKSLQFQAQRKEKHVFIVFAVPCCTGLLPICCAAPIR